MSINICFNSCTPKTTEVIKPQEEVVVEEPTKKDPKNPCVSFDDLGGYDREIASTAFVLYRDNLKANNFIDALPLWKQAYNMAPGSNGSVKYHFDDGVKIYKHLYENTKDEKLKSLYVDTIMMIYDKRMECFGEEPYVNGLKAFDYFYTFPQYSDSSEVFALFKSNIDAKGENADYFILNPFSKMVYDGVVNGNLSKEEGLKYAKLIYKSVEKGLSTCKDKQCDTWNIINGYAPEQMDLLEGIDDFYDCEHYKNKYYTLFLANRDSCEIVDLALRRLLRGKCDAKSPEIVDIQKVKNTTCYVAPEAPGTLRQAYDEYTKGNYRSAIRLFEQYVGETSDRETKAKYLLIISKIYYGDIKDFPRSRKFALDAAAMRPNWGEPYMIIGKLYASSGPLCGPGTGWDSQVVTWVAIDKFNQAKNVDPSFTKEANQWIAKYSIYMPKVEDVFFKGEKVGNSYFVPCWIQERTTVRTAD